MSAAINAASIHRSIDQIVIAESLFITNFYMRTTRSSHALNTQSLAVLSTSVSSSDSHAIESSSCPSNLPLSSVGTPGARGQQKKLLQKLDVCKKLSLNTQDYDILPKAVLHLLTIKNIDQLMEDGLTAETIVRIAKYSSAVDDFQMVLGGDWRSILTKKELAPLLNWTKGSERVQWILERKDHLPESGPRRAEFLEIVISPNRSQSFKAFIKQSGIAAAATSSSSASKRRYGDTILAVDDPRSIKRTRAGQSEHVRTGGTEAEHILIDSCEDRSGARIFVTPAETPGIAHIHRQDHTNDTRPSINVSNDIATLMDTVADLLDHAMKFFPSGKGNQMQDVLRSSGESLVRMENLHKDDGADKLLAGVFEFKGVSNRRAKELQRMPPPVQNVNKMQSYLKQYAKSYKQECLLDYANIVATFGGGNCDDVAALAAALAIANGLADKYWVVCAADKSHSYVLIGDGRQWVAFDPWPQCPTVCTLDVFTAKWHETVVAFEPGYTAPEGLKETLAAAGEKRETREAVVKKYLQENPEMKKFKPPSQEFVTKIFRNDAEVEPKEDRRMFSELLATTDPDTCYVSPLYPKGKQYNTLPIERWNTVSATLQFTLDEEQKGIKGVLGGLQVILDDPELHPST